MKPAPVLGGTGVEVIIKRVIRDELFGDVENLGAFPPSGVPAQSSFSLIGVALLEVRGRKAFLTEEGDVFLRRAKQLTQQMEELELLAFNIHQGWEAECVWPSSWYTPDLLISRALQLYYPKSRGTQLQLMDTVLTGTQDAIVDQQADLVITGHVPRYLGEPSPK